MTEASSGPRWRLTVWFERSGDSTTFDFDVEPRMSTMLETVVSYHGEREGRTVRVNVSIDRVSAWSLEEILR
jgi:hypothetical protein